VHHQNIILVLERITDPQEDPGVGEAEAERGAVSLAIHEASGAEMSSAR